MFRRKITESLEKWANKEDRKPLVLRGARQVGKTTAVNEFGKQFDNYLYVNMERDANLKLFDETDDVHALLEMLFLSCNVKKKNGRTLLFIDEIQNSPKAVAKLRYFYEDSPEIFVIAAGSLLETMLDRHISFPVGRVEYMAMHPCSFHEYLWAIGEERFADPIMDASLPSAFHDTMNGLFNTYALIGGMPEVVKTYVAKRDVLSLSEKYSQLITSYKDDVEKYAQRSSQINVIRYILENGWAFAGEAITLGNFAESSYKARETGDAFRTMEKAMLLELVYPITNENIPIVPDLKRSPKLIWLDIGLVNYASRIQKEYLYSNDLIDTWKGKSAEQVAAQELATLTDDFGQKRNFWVRAQKGATSEIDLVYPYENNIIPIEIKSGHNAHLKSLHQYMIKAQHRLAIRIWSGKFSVDTVNDASGKPFKLVNLPFYFMSAIPKIVEREI